MSTRASELKINLSGSKTYLPRTSVKILTESENFNIDCFGSRKCSRLDMVSYYKRSVLRGPVAVNFMIVDDEAMVF